MVDRFLAWPLPRDFAPDCGISFDGRKDDEWNKNKSWPIGTNLFTADQTRAMFLHALAVPAAPAVADAPPVRRPRELLAEIELARQEGWRAGLEQGWKQGRANALEEVGTERAANAAAPQEDAPLDLLTVALNSIAASDAVRADIRTTIMLAVTALAEKDAEIARLREALRGFAINDKGNECSLCWHCSLLCVRKEG